MELSNVVPRIITKRREKIMALPLYYSGLLQKKYTGEKVFKIFFGELRGSTIFLYSDEKHATYSEKVEMQNLRSMFVDTPRDKTRPWVCTLTLHKEEVQLKTDDLDAGEEWRGFIMTVATLKVPEKLQLLPGQMLRLQDVLKLEMERIAALAEPSSSLRQPAPSPHSSNPNNLYLDILSSPPRGFFDVSREEAEKMLEDNPDFGNIILRPASDNSNYAVSVRQATLPSSPVTKHYKLRPCESGFVIELDKPVMVPSLDAVVDHFTRVSGQSFQPYAKPKLYDTRIEMPYDKCIIQLNPLPSGNSIPQAILAPMIRNKPLSPPPLPPKPRKEDSDEDYMNPDIPLKGRKQ